MGNSEFYMTQATPKKLAPLSRTPYLDHKKPSVLDAAFKVGIEVEEKKRLQEQHQTKTN